MNKLFLTLIVAMFLFGCSNEKKEGWKFNTSKNVKSQGFKFDKTDYSKNNSNDNTSDDHNGCTAPCCSEN